MSEQNTNGKYVSPFIDAGLDREATIPESPLWSAARIRYRPLSADEESLIHSKLRISERTGSPTSLVSLYAEAFAGSDGAKGNLLDWDVKDGSGHKLVVKADTLRRLHPQFFDALLVTINGSAPAGNGEPQREQEAKN